MLAGKGEPLAEHAQVLETEIGAAVLAEFVVRGTDFLTPLTIPVVYFVC